MGDFDQLVISEPFRGVSQVADTDGNVIYLVEPVSTGAGGGTGDGITLEEADARYLRLTVLGSANGATRLDSTAKLLLAQLPAHQHLISEVTGLQAALNAKVDTVLLAPVATSGNFADLTGTVPTSALPPLAINDTFTVADQAAMLALAAQRGDMAVRSDNGRTYVLAAEPASVLGNWKEVLAAGQVQSVAGKTGVVALAVADIGGLQAALDATMQTSLADAKGDLFAGTAADAVARLAAGLPGQRLTPAPAAATGLAWTDGLATLAISGGSIATDASLGEIFHVPLTASAVLAAPTNARDGMRRTWRFAQDATGGRTITLASGAGGFVLGSQIPNTNLTGAAGKVGYFTACYYGPADRWQVLAFEPGV